MADGGRETIKEYLIKIGHEVEGSEKALSSMNALASSIRGVSAALAAVYSVKVLTDVNTKLKQMGDMSVALKAPVESIRGITRAAELAGVQVGRMQSALATMAEKQRTLPKFMETLGAQASGLTGQQVRLDSPDNVENMMRLFRAFKNVPESKRATDVYPFFRSHGLFESSADVDFMLNNLDKVQRVLKEHKELEQKYLKDTTDATQKAKKTMEEWSGLMTRLGLILQKAAISPDLIKSIEHLSTTLDEHSDEITKGLVKIGTGVTWLGERIARFFIGIGQWSDFFTGKKTWDEAWADSFKRNMEDPEQRKKQEARERILGDPSKTQENTRATIENTGALKAMKSWWESMKSFVEGIDKLFPSYGRSRDGAGAGGGDGSTPKAGPVKGWWTAERMKYAVDYLQKNAGLSEMGAAGLVARWTREAPGGPGDSNAIGGGHWGIAQWGLSRGGRAVAGMSFDEQLAKAAGELKTTEAAAANVLRKATTEYEAARGASMFERAEQWNPATGTDVLTSKTPVASVLSAIRGYASRTPSPPRRPDKISSLHVPSFAGTGLGPSYMETTQMANNAFTRNNNVGPFHTTVNVNGPNQLDATTLSKSVEKPMRQYASRIANIGSTLS